MEERHRKELRPIVRCYQCQRIEGEIWVLAYEWIWPLLRASADRVPRVARPEISQLPLAQKGA